jgi:hypothetical protein
MAFSNPSAAQDAEKFWVLLPTIYSLRAIEEVIRHQGIGQNPYTAEGLQPTHKSYKSFGLSGAVT